MNACTALPLLVMDVPLQLFPQMGPDPVPQLHRGVELIIHFIARMAGRQTTFEEAFSKHRYYLTESGTCMRTFHIAQVHIHRDVSRDSDVQPMLKMSCTCPGRLEVSRGIVEAKHVTC